MKNKIFNYMVFLLFVMLFQTACSQKKVDQTKNPFTFEKTGLPHQTFFCGVGLPDLISTDLAENVIGQIFKENGFQLTKNYLYQKDSSSFILNGYDKNHQIGYVYLDYGNLEDDGIIPWEEDSFAMFNESFEEPNRTSPKIAKEREFQNLKAWLASQSGANIKNMINYMNRNLLASEKELVAAVKKTNDEKFLRSAYIKLYQKQKKYTLSLNEIKRTIKNEGKGGVFIAVISVYDKALAVYPDFELGIEDMEPDTTKTEKKYTQEDALKYLRKNVNEFIVWSKS